jgi:ferredoxin
MKLSVEETKCQGHGRCYTLALDLLDCDDEGYVTIRGSAIEVPAGQLAVAEDVVGSCPEGAISLIDE